MAVLAAAGAVLWGNVLDFGRRTVEGPASVPHAGVLMIENVWIPLLGLRAPREDPNCVVHARIVQCPLISAAYLAEMVIGKTIRCKLQRFAEDNRNWGTCGELDPATGVLVDGPDSINRAMVRSGWAMADQNYTQMYGAIEEEAQGDRIGVWTHLFMEDPVLWGTLGPVNETNDANTVEARETRIRLFGIDAPELTQECLMNGIPYPCGILASAYLNRLVIGRRLMCHTRELSDGITWGRCGDSDRSGNNFQPDTKTLNEQMVLAGWAMASRDQTKDFVDAETEAQQEKRGMWAGDFVRPADWRDGKR